MKNKGKKLKIFVLILLCVVSVAVVFAFVLSRQCDSLDFTQVYSQADSTLVMYYDDYLSEFDYDSATIIDPGEPYSYKVGYGVRANTKDKAVVTMENGALHATGTGTARVEFDGKVYDITVKPAPISMFLMIGQSNMYGSEGSKDRSVANENGTAYSTFGISDLLTQENAAQFVPSALSGEGSLVSSVGTKQLLSKSPLNSLTDSGDGKIGLDSAFADKWHKLTGDKVWLINAAHTGKAIKKWIKGASEYNEAVALFKAAQQVMQKEIAAGHYVLKDYGYFWFHGCSDRENTASGYIKDFLSMHENLKKDLAFDIDSDGVKDVLRFCNVLMPRAGKGDCVAYRTGTYKDTTTAEYAQSFYDLEMRGHRVALYWLVNNPELKDINLVCNIGDRWVYMPDGSDGVKEYFNSRYKNGKIDYVTQKPQKQDWYFPDSPSDVHDNVHYNQIGYNEIGFEAAQNAAYTLGRVSKPQNVKTKVTFYDWTGYREVKKVKASIYNDSSTLVVPVVYPVYESKSVGYGVSTNLSYEYYDLKSTLNTNGGSLSSVGADSNAVVSVAGTAQREKGKNAFYWVGTIDGLQNKQAEHYVSNTLSLTGNKNATVKNSVHNNAVYRTGESVNLKHNHEWMIEWSGNINEKTNEDFSFVMFSEAFEVNDPKNSPKKYICQTYDAENGTLEIGFSYGENKIAVCDVSKAVKDVAEVHTYRIYNRVSADGTNCVMINVDSKYIGAFEGLSGVDFIFNFLGAQEEEICNYKINHIKIFEDCYCDIFGHTFSVSKTKTDAEKKGKYTYKCVCGYLYRASK